MTLRIKVDKIPGFPLPGNPASIWGRGVPRTTREFFTEVRTPFIRSTPLSVLDECPRKFLYAYKLGICPKVAERPLTLGSFVHLILKNLFCGRTEEEALQSCETALRFHQNLIVEACDPTGFLQGGRDVKGVLADLEEDYHKARAMALCFWRFRPFQAEKWEVLQAPDGTRLVEVMLETRIKGINPIRTPCDLALLNKETKQVWIVDFKTTSFDPRVRAIPTRISPQLALYRLSLQSHLDHWAHDGLLPPYEVTGSIHAIIKKPTIKYCPDTKDKGGFQCYVERLLQWYKDAEAKDPTNPPLVLDSNRFSAPVMTSELWGRLKRYSKLSSSPPNFDVFYRAGDSVCLKFNRPCPYMVLCNSSTAMIPDLVRTHFNVQFREDVEEQTDV